MTQQEIEARMLSGEPFTYGALSEWRASIEQGAIRTRVLDHDRLIDRTIQKLRRKGLIAFTREAGSVVWRPAGGAETSAAGNYPTIGEGLPDPLQSHVQYIAAALSWYDGGPASADVRAAWNFIVDDLRKAAAAPDLYEVLTLVFPFLTGIIEEQPSNQAVAMLRNSVRAALAKATPADAEGK